MQYCYLYWDKNIKVFIINFKVFIYFLNSLGVQIIWYKSKKENNTYMN